MTGETTNSREQPDRLPGATPQTAVMLTEQQAKDVYNYRYLSEAYDLGLETVTLLDGEMVKVVKPKLDPELQAAVDAISESQVAAALEEYGEAGKYSSFVEGLWVTSPFIIEKFGRKYNTWCFQVAPDEPGAHANDQKLYFGREIGPNVYLRNEDGSLEIAHTWQPIV